MDEDIATAVRIVFDFLRAYRAYELEAARLSHEADRRRRPFEADDQVQEMYREVLARYMAPRIVAADPSWSFQEPPTVDADKTRLVSAKRRGSTITVATEEPAGPRLPPDEVRYLVSDTELGPRIASRRVRGLNGRFVEEGL